MRTRIRATIAAGAFAVVSFGCQAGPSRPPARATLSEQAIVDSMSVAISAGRSDRALIWSERRRALAPNLPSHMICEAVALHNFVWTRPGKGRSPAALRTSLDRIEVDLKVIALLDSAGHAANDSKDRAAAGWLLGLQYENYGLHVDALMRYHTAFEATGGDSLLATRFRRVSARLQDPLARMMRDDVR